MLTDTTFWIDLLEERRTQRGPVHEFMAKHRSHSFFVSIVTWGELAEGFTRETDLNHLLRGVRVLPLPRQVVWEGSRIQRALSARLGENDTWIAATALTWGKRLVSRDNAFRRVPGLTVLDYAEE
jgi:predicted nucleic acid-binding protein